MSAPDSPYRSSTEAADPEPAQRALRVLVADDQALLRGSLRLLIDATDGLTSVGEAGTGIDAVRLARSEHPDVVLMDVQMPRMDGIEATREICSSPDTRDTRVIILTTFDLDEYVYAALHAGASGFLLKNAPPADLLTAIEVVAGGEALLAPSVTSRLIARFAAGAVAAPVPDQVLDGISAREREILALIASGLSNTEIASRLTLGMATIKTHVGSLLAKLDARDRAQLVIIAYESGLVRARRPSTTQDTSEQP